MELRNTIIKFRFEEIGDRTENAIENNVADFNKYALLQNVEWRCTRLLTVKELRQSNSPFAG